MKGQVKKQMNYYVEQKYYDDGKIKIKILSKEELQEFKRKETACEKEGIYYFKECANYDLYIYDLYIDVFNSLAKAQKFVEEIFNT